MKITFEELRRIKHSLPHGSISRIAKELNRDEQDVRNYFGALKFNGSTSDWRLEPGPDGGIVNIKDTSILDLAKKILFAAEGTTIASQENSKPIITINSSLFQEEKNHGHAYIKTTPKKATIQININKNFDDFSEIELKILINTIKSKLKTNNEIKFISKKRGSVLITLEMDEKDAEQLLKLIINKELKNLGVMKASLNSFQKKETVIYSQVDSLADYKQEIKQLIPRSLTLSFKKLDKIISKDSDYYDTFISIKSTYSRFNTAHVNGTIEITQHETENNKITDRFLKLVNDLNNEDLQLNNLSPKTLKKN